MSRLLLAILPLLISGATCQEPAPVELGRFPLRHAAFVQIYEKPDFTGPYPDKYRLVISTFDACKWNEIILFTSCKLVSGSYV